MQALHSVDAERRAEVFLLDILSHRMSVMAIFRQLPVRLRPYYFEALSTGEESPDVLGLYRFQQTEW
jgi:hypothetical protein